MYGKYLLAAVPVGHADLDLAVEAARPAQRRIDRVGPVRRRYDDDLAPALDPVHEREQLRDYALLDLARDLVALWRDRVDLVDEHDARRALLGLPEYLAQPLLALAVVPAHDLRAAHGRKVRVRLAGDGPCEQRLARPRRAVQQHALWGLDADLLEQLGVPHRQLDHLAYLLHLGPEAAEVVVRDARARRVGRVGLGPELERGALADDDGPARRRGARHDKLHPTAHRRAQGHAVALREYVVRKVAGHVLLQARHADLLGRREDYALGGGRLDGPGRDPVAYARPEVLARHPVDAYDPRPDVLGPARPQLYVRYAAVVELYYLPRAPPGRLDDARVGYPAARPDELARRLGHAQLGPARVPCRPLFTAHCNHR